jgi:hypothetical protein
LTLFAPGFAMQFDLFDPKSYDSEHEMRYKGLNALPTNETARQMIRGAASNNSPKLGSEHP